jgi:hypothetical protein
MQKIADMAASKAMSTNQDAPHQKSSKNKNKTKSKSD